MNSEGRNEHKKGMSTHDRDEHRKEMKQPEASNGFYQTIW